METVRHGDSWWRRDDDGTWYRWNEATRSWEFGEPDSGQSTQPHATAATYREPRSIARPLATLLGAGAVLDFAAVVAGLVEVGRWTAALGGTPVSDASLQAADLRLGVLSVALVFVWLATIPVFIVWFHRLYTNLPALGATEPRFGRGWAIGAWFVPFLNLWRPKQIADDIWRASDPQLPPLAGAQWRGRPVAGTVHWWWALYLLSNLLNQAAVRLGTTARDTAELRRQAIVETGASALDTAAALVALWFVLKMTARQEQRASLAHPG